MEEIKTQEAQTHENESNQETRENQIDWKELAYRYAAEIDNLRKRMERELRIKETEIENRFVNEFIPVFIDINHLLNYRKDSAAKMIQKKINKLFEKFNLKQIDTNELDFFTEQYHECVAITETENESYDNKIASVIQHGYIYKERVIKPSSVVVYKYKNRSEI